MSSCGRSIVNDSLVHHHAGRVATSFDAARDADARPDSQNATSCRSHEHGDSTFGCQPACSTRSWTELKRIK